MVWKQSAELTVETIQVRVDHIRAIASNDETAHSEEDDLRTDVLRAIANGTCADPAKCAAAVLKTEDIDFARWYA